MKTYDKYIAIFLLGGFGYSLIEILWRGYTHISMALAGGICTVVLWYLNNKLRCGIFLKSFTGTLFITLTELVFGIIFNVILKMNVWDYSHLPFNFMGQICITYCFYWFLICLVFYSVINIKKMVH